MAGVLTRGRVDGGRLSTVWVAYCLESEKTVIKSEVDGRSSFYSTVWVAYCLEGEKTVIKSEVDGRSSFYSTVWVAYCLEGEKTVIKGEVDGRSSFIPPPGWLTVWKVRKQ